MGPNQTVTTPRLCHQAGPNRAVLLGPNQTVTARGIRAESYALSDPRSACFYSRRAVEHLVDHLYDVLGLPVPYVSDLAARINDAGFKAKVGVGNATKMIRKLGNYAVHDQKPIPPQAALDALRQLHHLMVWA